MVKIVETDDPKFRRYNTKYPCVLFLFSLKHDKNFVQKTDDLFDYMPTTDEILEFITLADKRIKGLREKIIGVLNGK